MYKKYQAFKWIAIILAVILVLGICGAVISLISRKNNKVGSDAKYTVGIVATFDFGEKKTSTGEESLHSDGSVVYDQLEFVDGDYTLVLTQLIKVYKNAFDAMGNSCLKLGTASDNASFKFTVPSDVLSVVIYVAGYKDNKAKIYVNLDDFYTIESLSDEGEYTAIEIQVPSNREITFITSTGGLRAMIDRVEFIGKVKI